MKRLTGFLLLLLFFSALTGYSQEGRKGIAATESGRIDVYYFHTSYRCATCQAVESETEKALKELYPVEMEKGKIVFSSLNIEEEKGEKIAESLEVAGQALIFVKGEQKIDLTDKGFLYARSKPEKLQENIKKTVDNLL